MKLLKDEIVKSEILEQAQKLFQQFGLKKTTMDEIAAACGKAKSTLYYYFKSKEEVFDEVIDLELKSLRILIKEKMDTVSSIRDKVMTYFLEFHKEVLNKLNLYRIVKHELANKAFDQIQFYRIMNFEKAYMVRILEDGYDTGEFVNVDKDNIPWFAELLLAAFFGIVRYSIETDQGFDQKKLELAIQVLIPKIVA